MQIPYGGKEYISSLLNIDTRTIYQGKIELTKNEIIEFMKGEGIVVSKKIVSDLLKKHGHVKRKIV